ncbi:MAG: radical SAM protein, partial [Lachnospiraceae bacterium]|nr:radical SAM protein [Lachnospiraceae bacterium]
MITTENIYKPSSFTYILEDGQDTILYNSMEGVDSIQKMPINCRDKIDKYFSMQTIPYESEPVLDALVRYHYVIPYEWNEEKLINNLYVDCMSSSILHLVILPTEQCNFRCKYCYESFTRGKMSDETMDAIIKYVRIHIHQYTGLQVSWFGGEPALEIDSICKMSQAFLAICKHAKRRYWADITSNGYFINKENFEKLYQCNVFDYQITIDGIKSTHDCQRVLAGGGGSFDRIIDNLMDIKNHKKYKRWNITIRTNFSKEIYDIFDEYIEFYYSRFHDDSRFCFLFRPAGDWGGTVVKDYAEHLLEKDGLALVFEKMLESPK